MESKTQEPIAKVLLFGSYYLGVSSNAGDIDLICVVPKFINRENHFNIELFNVLNSIKGMEKISLIKDA